MAITIVGLGPGASSLMTREAWEVVSHAREVYLRTSRHPVVADLPPGTACFSFDALYEQADDFAVVYRGITERILQLARRPEGVVYCVPGHPLVGESTVTALLEQADSEGLPIRIVAGVSFIEPTLTALQVDAMAGLQVVDALDVALRLHPPLNPDMPALLGQLYDRGLASDAKLTLMNQYPDEHPVALVHGAGTDGQEVERVPLYAIDHSRRIGHLTSLFVPALPQASAFESFQETIARLRAPDGCPWDREQTHQSLRSGLLEEAAEVLDALDQEDMESLCEELGDLLLHIAMQSQIAAEDGDFTAADVIAGIEAKIRRRHPHVFADAHVSGTAEVLVRWDEIKETEKRGREPGSAMDRVARALPALARVTALIEKAAGAGAGQPTLHAMVAAVHRRTDALVAADGPLESSAQLGDLLLAVATVANRFDLDAEAALREAGRRFEERFRGMEVRAAEQRKPLSRLSPLELQALWQGSEPEPD